MKTKLEFNTLPRSYEEMMRFHLLRPIHDKVELGNALEILDALAGHRLNREQEDYFDALSTLVEAYERQHVPGTRRRGIDLLRHLLEANAMNAADLSRLLGKRIGVLVCGSLKKSASLLSHTSRFLRNTSPFHPTYFSSRSVKLPGL